jgi:hypothetical protein
LADQPAQTKNSATSSAFQAASVGGLFHFGRHRGRDPAQASPAVSVARLFQPPIKPASLKSGDAFLNEAAKNAERRAKNRAKNRTARIDHDSRRLFTVFGLR